MYGRSPNKGFQSISDARITATRCGCSSSPWMHTDPPLIGEMHCEHKLPHIPSFSSRFLQDPSGMFNNLGQWVKNGQWFADVCSTWLMTHVIAFLCVCVFCFLSGGSCPALFRLPRTGRQGCRTNEVHLSHRFHAAGLRDAGSGLCQARAPHDGPGHLAEWTHNWKVVTGRRSHVSQVYGRSRCHRRMSCMCLFSEQGMSGWLPAVQG